MKRSIPRVGLIAVFVIFAFFYAHAQDFKELRSDHFILKYDPTSQDSVYKIRDDAEYLFRKITNEFGVVRSTLWAWENRAVIFIAKNRESYMELFRCPSWSAACVNYIQRIIYTYPSQDRFSSILAHELTHIIFREYVGTQKLPLWVDEGMSMYMELRDTFEASTIMTSMKSNILNKGYTPFGSINSTYSLATSADPGRFYMQSYSMVYFLVKRFGQQDFGEFLSYLKNGESVEDAIRKAFSGLNNLQDFEESWKRFYTL